MVLLTWEDYHQALKTSREVLIERSTIQLGRKDWVGKRLGPEEFRLETRNVWSFPERGSWATHTGSYRGNWSPHVPRNLLLRYTQSEDTILDQMMGSGTTLVECKLLNRNALGVDINPDAVMVAKDRLNFDPRPLNPEYDDLKILTYVGDARNLDKVEEESIDFIATHPPYASIIPYSQSAPVAGDLSRVHDIHEYIDEIRRVAEECIRVLKPGKHCGILIGDTRRLKHHVPIAFRVLQAFLDVGFILREDIIKRQWKMKSTREKWRGRNYDFYLLAYEHLFVFRKPEIGESLIPFKESVKWWD